MFNLFSTTKAYENLDGLEFKEKFAGTKGAILVDVRTAGEFGSGSIKGAKNIDFMSASFKDQFLKCIFNFSLFQSKNTLILKKLNLI